MPTRFQQRRGKGWTKPPGGRCVSRPSRFGNPFPVESIGDPAAHAAAVARFREWITSPEQSELLAEARRDAGLIPPDKKAPASPTDRGSSPSGPE
jgi:hypothetical protein